MLTLSSLLCPIDAYNLKMTCNHFCNMISSLSILLKKEINKRLQERFGEEFNQFREFLSKTGAVITGDYIFQCLIGESWRDKKFNIYLSSHNGDKYPVKKRLKINYIRFQDINHLIKQLPLMSVCKNSYYINKKDEDCVHLKSINEIVTKSFTLGNDLLLMDFIYRCDILRQNDFNIIFESPEKILSNAINFEIIFIKKYNENINKFKIVEGSTKNHRDLILKSIIINDDSIMFSRRFDSHLCDYRNQNQCHPTCPIKYLYGEREHISVSFHKNKQEFTTIFIL